MTRLARSETALRALFVLAPLAAAPSAQVFVVDDDGGPGVDFPSITAAIQRVPDGSTILVREGTYSAFDLSRPMVVAAASGADVEVLGQVRVRAIPAGGQAVLSGLAIGSQLIGGGLTIEDCEGTVFVEDCSARTISAAALLPYYAAHVSSSRDVVMTRTTLLGTAGGLNQFIGGEALRVTTSNVHLFECDLEGGVGAFNGYAGGAGLVVRSAFVSSADSRIQGGEGGIPGTVFGCFGATGGSGGPGVTLGLVGGQPAPEVVLVGGSLAGGQGGSGDDEDCPTGPSGAATQPGPYVPLVIPSPAHGLVAPDPLTRGLRTELTFTGAPGEVVAYLIGTTLDPSYSSVYSGTLVLGLSLPGLVVVGPMPPEGTLTVQAGPFPPGATFVQALFLGTSLRIATPVAIVPSGRVAPFAALAPAPQTR